MRARCRRGAGRAALVTGASLQYFANGWAIQAAFEAAACRAARAAVCRYHVTWDITLRRAGCRAARGSASYGLQSLLVGFHGSVARAAEDSAAVGLRIQVPQARAVRERAVPVGAGGRRPLLSVRPATAASHPRRLHHPSLPPSRTAPHPIPHPPPPTQTHTPPAWQRRQLHVHRLQPFASTAVCQPRSLNRLPALPCAMAGRGPRRQRTDMQAATGIFHNLNVICSHTSLKRILTTLKNANVDLDTFAPAMVRNAHIKRC